LARIFFKPIQGKVKIYGNKDKRWAWCHVIDLGEAFPLIVENKDKAKGKIFLVGSTENVPTFEQLVIATARVQGYNGDFDYEPAPEGSFYKLVDFDVPHRDFL